MPVPFGTRAGDHGLQPRQDVLALGPGNAVGGLRGGQAGYEGTGIRPRGQGPRDRRGESATGLQPAPPPAAL